MNREQFSKVMAFVIAAIGKPEREISDATLDVYYELLRDLPYRETTAAVKNMMAREEYPVLPPAGKIRKAVINIMRRQVLTAPQAWGMVSRAIQSFGYYREEQALESMPESVARVVRWIGWQPLCLSDNVDVVRAQFMRMFEAQESRQEQDALMPPDVKQFLAGAGNSLLLPEG